MIFFHVDTLLTVLVLSIGAGLLFRISSEATVLLSRRPRRRD